nr:MAG TPA: PvdO maturation, periplasm, HYDROLASE.24A [Bacteriophage sp.]
MKNKGVTLIALAVTIVVMLILAGVTISVLNGENGIVKQAQKAKEESKIKELKEKVRIDIAGKRVENINGELRVSVLKEILDKYFDNVPVETQITSETKLKAKEEYGKYEMKISDIDVGEITYETSYTIFKDVNGEQVPIPEGYIVSENSDENIVNKGLVISDSRGNEYVWISCTVDSSSNKLQYKRTEWGVEKDGTDNSRAIKDELTLKDIDVTYSKTDTDNGINEEISKEIVAQINAEKESIKKYGGYYIGRYEVGKDNKTAVIKAEQEPYVNIKWSKAYELAKGIGGGEGATTYLCSSYSWDTAINFIQNTTGKNYATSIIGFNGNWKSQEVKDSSGKVIKPVNTAQRLNTGLTTALCNIYDMGGNVGEFTTELNPGTSETVVLRGGYYNNFNPAGDRGDFYSGLAGSHYGFRATLFLK